MHRNLPFILSLIVLVVGQAEPQAPLCGGYRRAGDTRCSKGWTCVPSSPDYPQCLRNGIPPNDAPVAATETSSAPDSSLTGLAAVAPTSTPTREIGKLPSLGWNSWNAFRFDINEEKIMSAANAFVSLGLKDAGYQYISIDDAWSERSRDNVTGRILPDLRKFPSGIKGLAKRIHDLGLKIGIYSDAGTHTCGGYPGSLGYENIDAQTFSGWGIDSLKYDNCNIPANWTDDPTPQLNDWYNSNSAIRYRYMTHALASVPRPIEFTLCIWGTAHVTEWGARVGHSWRVWYDSTPDWDYISFIINLNSQVLSSTNFYGHNDMDMMEIGNGNLTIQEARTHFAAWTFMKSPILLGTDLFKLSDEHLAIIKNRELLAFHQDPNVGEPAMPFMAFDEMPATSPPEYYAGASSKGIHVFIINFSNTTATKRFDFAKVPGLSVSGSGSFQLHDMWTGEALVEKFDISSRFSLDVDTHDTVAYLITSI
ncbi:glycoside hydrolase superfamily [Panaeolus papilionaceus]|nr:glycoside hydrolase superfamily [Panaeolus papilionaceus]